MSGKPFAVFSTLALAAALGGCGGSPPPKAAASVPAPAPANDVSANEKDFASNGADDVTKEDLSALNRKGYLQDIFFDFDSSTLRGDQKDRANSNASWMKRWPSVKVRIEGHCDERGTAQYNLALGEQRAQMVRDFIASLGVEAERIEVVSMGKERPLVPGHDEASWAQNRRGHFVVTAR
jgi:peptidoglycan-associated lipoprotein